MVLLKTLKTIAQSPKRRRFAAGADGEIGNVREACEPDRASSSAICIDNLLAPRALAVRSCMKRSRDAGDVRAASALDRFMYAWLSLDMRVPRPSAYESDNDGDDADEAGLIHGSSILPPQAADEYGGVIAATGVFPVLDGTRRDDVVVMITDERDALHESALVIDAARVTSVAEQLEMATAHVARGIDAMLTRNPTWTSRRERYSKPRSSSRCRRRPSTMSS